SNWPEYDRGLIQRGDITVWLSPEAIASWKPQPNGTRGGQRKYSDLAIETAITLRLVFPLPLRQAEGFLNSLFTMMDTNLPAQDHTTLSRRGENLGIELRRVPTDGPIHLIVDSTGLSVVGQGEWAAAKHGGNGRRGWKKLHLGVTGSGVIVAQELTDANVDDASTGRELIEAVQDDISSFTADAAYDTIAITGAANALGATVVIPPARAATVSARGRRSDARDRTIRSVKRLGRRRWKRESGYHRQGTVENTI
ncbi:MAG: IS5 family transposase, partial [bacterium]|nr:IS5 family transposase [bacterium]